jgi:hypothetical protein
MTSRKEKDLGRNWKENIAERKKEEFGDFLSLDPQKMKIMHEQEQGGGKEDEKKKSGMMMMMIMIRRRQRRWRRNKYCTEWITSTVPANLTFII